MFKLLSHIFGKRKDGLCWFWEHDFPEPTERITMHDTGKYIDGKPIQQKIIRYESFCKKCNKWYVSGM